MKSNTPLIFSRTLGTPHTHTKSRIENEYWHHRSPWMESMLESIEVWFKNVFGDHYDFRVLSMTASGAREAFLTNLVRPGARALILGESFAKIAEVLGIEVLRLEEIGRMPVQAPTAVFIEHVREDGTLVDLKSLVHRIRSAYPTTPIIADLSASFGADSISLQKILLDGLIIVPERALGGIPGSTVVGLTDTVRSAIQAVRHEPGTLPYSLDLLKYDKAWEKTTTPYSPNISSTISLASSIELIEANGGLVRHLERHEAYARIVRTILKDLRVIHTKNETNAYTLATLPRGRAPAFITALEKAGIGIDAIERNTSAVMIGHQGFLNQASFERFAHASARFFNKHTPVVPVLSELVTPETWDPRFRPLFSIDPEEFIHLAKTAAHAHTSNQRYRNKITSSAEELFSIHSNYDLYGCFRGRRVGFIGAGNTVRETVERCLAAGIKDIMVYAPSLAAGKEGDGHRTKAYWNSRGVNIAKTAREVFFESHTVVLLPTFHNDESLRLFRKQRVYRNEHLVNRKLLADVERVGKMDLLINASAREGLIDRAALAQELSRGWLTYVSDELPPVNDPVIRSEHARMTGHVGGSSHLTRKRIAENTRKILESLVHELYVGKPLEAINYRANVLNEHLIPAGSRRVLGPLEKIRILLTDTFDTTTLDIEALGKEYGVAIEVRDISKELPTETRVKSEIFTFRPHILMMRTRTIITENIATLSARTPDLVAIVRPGVGIDNIYPGLESVSRAGIRVINEPHGNSFSVGEMTLHFILNGKRNTLLAPGPTQFKPKVFSVMDTYQHPHTNVFRQAYKAMHRRLRPLIDRGFLPVSHAVPSTGLMEAAIVNLTAPNDRGLIIAHGKFGNRFVEIAKASGRSFETLQVTDSEWGRAFTPQEIAAHLKNDRRKDTDPSFSFLCFQQNETSSGVAYSSKDIRAIIKAARTYNPNIMIIMDGVSGVGAHALDFTTLEVDAVIVGSQKAIGVSSGLTYLSLSARAVRYLLALAGFKGTLSALQKHAKKSAYLAVFEREKRVRHLSLLRLLLEDSGPTDDVPSIFHILSTLASLNEIAQEGGFVAVQKRHHRLASFTRNEAKRMRLKSLSRPPFVSDSVTPLLMPEGVDATKMRNALLVEYGFSVAGSQCDYWKPSLVRVGHVGYAYLADMVRCMRGIRILLRNRS